MKKNLTDAARLHNIENGISDARNTPEILERMNSYGYTEERITAGEELLKNARRQVARHSEEFSDLNEWRIMKCKGLKAEAPGHGKLRCTHVGAHLCVHPHSE
jgi:hypothetical protein